jgi:thymidylate synthase (FAD)
MPVFCTTDYRGEKKVEQKILDHGYAKLIEFWGSDQAIIESARMSTDKGFLGWDPGPCPTCAGNGIIQKNDHDSFRCLDCDGKGKIPGDAKLLRRLYDYKHSTPFEFAGMTIEIQAPIMVFREWHRHRTQSYSEMSARYTPLPNDNYMPTIERCLVVSATNKQAGTAKGADELTHATALSWLEQLSGVYKHAETVYQAGLRYGVPKELARLCVPVGRYSRMRASTDLRNWLGFLTLRMAPGAQHEIRVYANAVGAMIAECFPRTWDLYIGNPGETPKAL